MTVKFEDLPPELWLELERWLSVSDLLQLRVTSKKMLQNISQQQMWKRICYRDWYKYILDEEEIYCKVSNKREIYEEIDDWCVQARRLYHGDYHVLHRIEKLTELPLNNTFWSKFDIILRGKYDTLLPILYKITTQDGERNSDTKYGLELKTCAQHLLDHILHGPFYQLAWRGTDDLFPDADYLEPLFLDIAKFDSAYPLISGKILEVRQRIRNRIDKKINSQWDTFWNDSTVNKMRLIIASTLKTLRIGKCKTAIPEECFFVEDCFITRIYAGEVIGHRFLLLVILQSICRQYNIITHVSYDYLIIEDPTHPDGEFYFQINVLDIDSGFKSRSELRAMLSHTISVVALGVDYNLDKYFKPLSALQCLEYTIKDILNIVVANIGEYYTSLENPDLILNDYSAIYLGESNESYCNCFEMKKHVEKLFPYSRQQVYRCIVLYMVDIYCTIRKICGDPSDVITDDIFFRSSTNDYNCLKTMVKNELPWDYNHVMGCTAFANVRDYAAQPTEGTHILTYDKNYENPIHIGTFMRLKKKQLVLIISQPICRTDEGDDGIIHKFDCMGPSNDELIRNLDNGFTYPITVEEINAFVDVLTPTNTLGRIFSSFDRDTGSGTLNIKTKDTIERELKKYNVVLLKGETHKRPKFNM